MIAGLFGRTGSGKSTLFKRMCRAARRCIVIDPLSEHEDVGAVIRSEGEFRGYWKDNYRRERWHIVIQPIELDEFKEMIRTGDPAAKKKAEQLLEPYLRIVSSKGRNYVLGVDEVDTFVSLHQTNDDISTLINYGRHWQIHLIAVARRTQAVPPELIAQCSDLFVFQMTRPGDIEYLAEYLGPAATARVRSLDTFEYVHWHVSGKAEVGKIEP